MSFRVDGEQGIATSNGPAYVRSAVADYYKRVGGLLPVTILVVLAIEWLPRTPEGYTEPVSTFVTGLILVVLCAALMRVWRPSGLFWKWTLRWALGFGVLFCLAAPLLGH